MTRTTLAVLLLSAFASHAHAEGAKWRPPTGFTTASGVEYGLSPLLQYDWASYSDDRLTDGSHRFEDNDAWRRTGVALYVRKKGVFDFIADYDVKAEAWMDAYFRLHTAAGSFRLGQFKTPVGMGDGGTSSAATMFIERALPEAAIHQGRRQGLDWSYARDKTWLFNAGFFSGGNLDGRSDGRAVGGRVIYTPINEPEGRILHLGVSASREWRSDETARIAVYPEVAITPVRLVDSGRLGGSDAIDRYGLELAWRSGPWTSQGEWLGATAHRDSGLQDFHARGGYVESSWMATGETKPYKGGGFGNPRPQHRAGAVELAARYSTIDLDDGAIDGGRQHDWSLGANWYLGKALKLSVNYIRAHSERQDVNLDPTIILSRAQIAF